MHTPTQDTVAIVTVRVWMGEGRWDKHIPTHLGFHSLISSFCIPSLLFLLLYSDVMIFLFSFDRLSFESIFTLYCNPIYSVSKIYSDTCRTYLSERFSQPRKNIFWIPNISFDRGESVIRFRKNLFLFRLFFMKFRRFSINRPISKTKK